MHSCSFLSMAAGALFLVACSGSTSSNRASFSAVSSPAVSLAAVAAVADPCSVLSNDVVAPLGQPAGTARPTTQATGGGIKVGSCLWAFGTASLVELTVYVLSPQYAGPKDFAARALTIAADSGAATVQAVSGVGDAAGIEIPPTPDAKSDAEFYAQKDSVVFKLIFRGTKAATWPTTDQLTQVGKAIAAKLF